MCGIVGALSLSGAPFEPALIARMADRVAHRGPDGEGAVLIDADGRWTLTDDLQGLYRAGAADAVDRPTLMLGHRRLSIIELTERGAQPMADEERRCWITFNGELYNYIELRERLIERGHRFSSASDTEVVLKAYLEWGRGALNRFNGMFAFAIWDAREKQLFCARDHLGVKPFYFYRDADRLLFASEQKALLAGLSGRPSANPQAMADFLAFSYVPGTATMFAGVEKLAPGCWLSVGAGGELARGRYWDPEFSPAPPRPDGEWAEELRALLDDAVRLQVRSDVPLGAHLSGGIDSSTVTCLAAQRLPSLTTFTARFAEGGQFDETRYARLVAERVGTDYREITPRPADLVELLPKILYHLDEPVEAASVFGKYHVAEIVSDSVKVVLGGQGGDELFGGYDWYIKSAATAMSFGANANLAQPRLQFLLSALRQESAKRLLKSLWKNRGDGDLARVFCRNWSRLDPAQIEKIFRAEVYRPEQTPERRFLDAFDELDVARPADAMFKFDMRYYLESLLTSEDRLAMAFSVESRVPLLDYRIAELAARVGFEQKATPGTSKRLLRLAVADVVPAEILARRDKRGFPTPIGRWLEDPKLALMEQFVFNDNPFAERYFDLHEVRRLYRSKTLLSSDWAERLWRILNLCAWGQTFELS